MSRPAVLASLALLTLLVPLGGCGGGSVVAPPAGPPATTLRVGMLEYRFQLSAATLQPGTVTVVATNAGSSEHDVVFHEQGADLGRSAVLPPGAQQTFRIRVAPGGPVDLECTVPGHEAAGMRATVDVAAG
jgi:plastocyanin